MLPVEYEAMHLVELNHWWFRGRRRVLVDLLRNIAEPEVRRLSILDYGCGTGGNTRAYSAFGAVVGIELAAAAIRLAKVRGGAGYCRAEGTELPFRENIFNVVIASDVLEHIEDDVAAVSEIGRVLRRHGTAIISVPAHPWLFSEHDEGLHHYRRYTKHGFRTLVEHGGLRIKRLSYWNAALFPAICLRRFLRKGRHVQHPRSDTNSPPWPVNEALASLLAGEAAILRHMQLPWGLSLIATAELV